MESEPIRDPAAHASAAQSLSAADLLKQINDDLATLATNPPTGSMAAFVTGVLTVPTVGTALLVTKGLQEFQRTGAPSSRTRLSLRQAIGLGELQYGADTSVRSVVEAAKTHLRAFEDQINTARRSFFTGFVVGGALSALVAGLVIAISVMVAHFRAAAAAEEVRVAAAQLQAQQKAEVEKKAAETAQALAQQKAEVEKKAAETAQFLAQQKAEMERKAAETAKAEHAKYLAAYTATVVFPADAPTGQRIAVIVADEELDHATTQLLVKHLQSQGVTATGGLFTDRFVSDGLFDKILSGDNSDIKRLELAKQADKLMLVKKNLRVSRKTNLPVLTADLALHARIVSAETGTVIDSYDITTVAAGTKKAAETQAMEEALSQFPQQTTTDR